MTWYDKLSDWCVWEKKVANFVTSYDMSKQVVQMLKDWNWCQWDKSSNFLSYPEKVNLDNLVKVEKKTYNETLPWKFSFKEEN